MMKKKRQQGDDEKKTGMKEREKEKDCPLTLPSRIKEVDVTQKSACFWKKRTDEHWRKKNFPGRGFHDLRSRSLWWANTRSLYGRPGYLAFVNNLYFTNDVLHPSATYQGIALARSSALCTIFPLLLSLLQLPPFLTRALSSFFFYLRFSSKRAAQTFGYNVNISIATFTHFLRNPRNISAHFEKKEKITRKLQRNF